MPLSLVKISAHLVDIWRRYLNFLSGQDLWDTLYMSHLFVVGHGTRNDDSDRNNDDTAYMELISGYLG
jgi:hypothetical protein